MTLEQSAVLFSKLSANIQSIEFLLRVLLIKNGNNSPVNWHKLDNMQVGEIVSEDELTNYDSLRDLINKYNSQIARAKSEKVDVDGEILRIRDALAHGRVFASTPHSTLRIIKFSRPSNGRVAVEFSEEANEDWLNSKIGCTHSEIEKLKARLDSLH